MGYPPTQYKMGYPSTQYKMGYPSTLPPSITHFFLHLKKS